MLLRVLLPVLAMIIAAASPTAAQRAAPVPQDVAGQVEHLRELLGSDQGAEILSLLGDPRVRQAILQDPASRAPERAEAGTAGQMMDDMLSGVRGRLWELALELGQLPNDLAAAFDRLHAKVPLRERLWLGAAFIVFLAGGVGAQWLFFHLARPWRMHFDALALSTARERARAVRERLLFGTLIIGAFAAGSMGAFLLFAWPPLTGSILLGYLLVSVLIRLSMTVTRFFLAPSAERLRLVRMSNEAAWFWHRWVARLAAVAAIGGQMIMVLRSVDLPPAADDLLLQLLLLLLTVLGIVIAWRMPSASVVPGRVMRGPVPRLLVSLALLLDWLLFLTGASSFGWTLLILSAVPVAIFVLSRSITTVMLGDMPEANADGSAWLAISERITQAIVILAATALLTRVWHIDMMAMSAMDTPMMRIARGLLEALVILVIADVFWQVVRVLIDARLADGVGPPDLLDGDQQRRRARLQTLLPVLRNFALFIVLVMASLSALAAMGLQIGPLLAGAGVVGIAVGFGAQTLVRDIISGIFFLLDDAFRVGEYIESGGIRGTVESFSLRSVKLRHINGQLHTVPFGDLKAITNFSRDWVVETVQVIVTYATDLDLLDRVVEGVSDELMADPATAPEIIEPLRSLGVQAMTDTGLQIGLMFKTRPGRQFGVRRAVFSRIKLAFTVHDIRFAAAAGGLEAAASA